MKNLPTYDQFLNEKDDDNFFSSRIAAQQLRKDTIKKMGESHFHKMYKSSNTSFILKALEKAKWFKFEDAKDEWYESISAIVGKTDGKNHTKDTLDMFKKLTINTIKNEIPQQNLNFYNTEGKIFDMVIVKGIDSGWSVKTAWSDGSKAFKAIARQIR